MKKYFTQSVCSECPFLKQNGVPLTTERKQLMDKSFEDDNVTFKCHKAVYDKDINKKPTRTHRICLGSELYRSNTGKGSVVGRMFIGMFYDIVRGKDKVVTSLEEWINKLP